MKRVRQGAVKPVSAPWVRTRLRAAPGAAWALAVLVALTACLAAAFPRALDRYADAGLDRALTQARPDRTSVLVTAPQPDLALSARERAESMRPEPLAGRYGKVLAAVEGAPLPVDRAQSAYGVRTTESLPVPEPWLPQPSGLPAQFYLAAQAGLGDHAEIGSGRLPRATGGPVTAATGALEAAVTAETARTLRIKVGSVLHVPGVERAPFTVRVTGVLAPRDPDGAYWSTQPVLRKPSLISVGPPGMRVYYWLGALLLAPEAGPALLGTAGTPVRYWQAAPRTGALHAHDLSALTSAVAGLESGPGLREVRAGADPAADVSTDLDAVFDSFDELRSGIGRLVAVAAVGAGTVAGVVLLMSGGLAADRRRAELALLRARGASLRGVV
ncbi:ABC transporter permease, partial [Streptomyces sp. STCH 565 A]|nr:ABC transporter permease [Streptomyces sp. STCH 565 A]